MQKNCYMLTLPKYNKSARVLATQLGLIPTSVPDKVNDGIVSIRYGNSSGVFENDTQYNNPNVIKLCGDSFKFSEWCKQNNINSPIYTPYEEFVGDTKYPFLLRRHYHRAGRDIIIVKDQNDIPNNTSGLYHVTYSECDREFGVHFVAGNVVKIFEKFPFNNNAHPIIKSTYFGYHYKLILDIENNFTILQNLCKDIAIKIGLGFGRFDVGYSTEHKKYTIFEINTAPGLNLKTSNLYSQLLRPVLRIPNDYEEYNRTD